MIAIFAPLGGGVKGKRTRSAGHLHEPQTVGEGSLGPLAIGDLVEGWIEGLENYTVKSLAAKTKRKTTKTRGCWGDVG